MMKTLRLAVAMAVSSALAGCAIPEGPPLVSAQFPPGTGMVNAASEPQTLNSLPPGAANLSAAPGATAPNYLSFKVGGR